MRKIIWKNRVGLREILEEFVVAVAVFFYDILFVCFFAFGFLALILFGFKLFLTVERCSGK